MATNLSPELLALLQQQNAGTYNKNNLQAILSDGRYYMPEYGGGGGGGEGGFDNPGTFNGYQSYREEDAGKKQGTGQFFGADGTYKNDYEWKDDNLNEMLFALAAGGLAFLPGGAVSTLSGGAPATGAASAGGYGVAGDAYLPGAFGAAGDAAMPGALSIGGSLGTAAPLTGLEGYLAAGGAAAGGAAGASGAAGGSGAAAAGGSGLLSSLGGASSLLGPAATVLGGLAGSQGQKTEQTSERKTDPRVDPYLFGDGTNPGLLGYTQQLLARQMAPGGLQGYDDMKSLGLLNMNIPVAGNGFSRFSNR
jgi:hypothetical protein